MGAFEEINEHDPGLMLVGMCGTGIIAMMSYIVGCIGWWLLYAFISADINMQSFDLPGPTPLEGLKRWVGGQLNELSHESMAVSKGTMTFLD